METSIELVLFMIVASVAILAAVMMLLSENAVHAALFLIVNFACVAFLFLMLNAAFLALVQITVYAGAIMVLFMFVIMLLGAERLLPEDKPKFPWLPPLAIALTSLFLIVAFVGVLRSDVSGTEPEPLPPQVRAINVLPSFSHVEVALNDTPLGEVLARGASDMVALEAGEYTLSVVGYGRDGSSRALEAALVSYNDPSGEMNLLEMTEARLNDGVLPAGEIAITEPILSLAGNQDLSLVLTALPDGRVGILPVYEDYNAVRGQRRGRLQVVHAAPSYGAIDLANISQYDRAPGVLFEGVAFGQASDQIITRAGDTHFGLYEAGLIERDRAAATGRFTAAGVDRLAEYKLSDFTANSSSLYIVAPPINPNLRGLPPDVLRFEMLNRPSFGSPTSIGFLLFTDYMLPFQIIALLLLASMIGAIVLTRDQIPLPRQRFPRRLANVPGNPPVGEAGQD